MASPGPLPEGAFVEPKSGSLTTGWLNWLQVLLRIVSATVVVLGRLALLNQSAAIATAILYRTRTGTMYRITWALRISQVATTSSAIRITVGWTDRGQAMTFQGTLVNGNTLLSADNGTITVFADYATDITYAVSYASVGAQAAKFSADIALEALP